MSKKVTFIQQNDTHGSMDLHHEMFWSSDGPVIHQVGGFARIASYVKKIKRQKENVLFFDGGDLFHGTSPLVQSKGEAILKVLQNMPLDGFVPGNWDYAYGKDKLISLTKQLPFETIACNLYDENSHETVFARYMMKELTGLKVGIIGLTYPYVDQTMNEEFSTGLTFSLGVDEVRESVEKLQKEKVDLIVLLSHMGLPLDVKVASLVDGIHVILSGHSHDRVAEPIKQGETLIVQSGSSSSFLGQLEIEVHLGKVIDYTYELFPLWKESFEEDEYVKELVSEIIDPFRSHIEEKVGETRTILHRMTLNKAPMDQLITDSYRHTLDVDLAFSHGWRYGTPIPKGLISLYDLHSIIPTNPELFTLEMEGEQLQKILENNLESVFSPDPFGQKGGYILRSSGLFMTFKPYNPKGNRIQELFINGERLNSHKIYKIAGAGGQLFKKNHSMKNYKGIFAVDVMKDFLKDKKTVAFDEGQTIINV
ncbi:bifunctional metallophosphatase/5'-nucleotidase [Bacillus niameyensis]|uniref:bifunctional metallophosphatase/5'-nucleotidase n=1 Tax=Bacillus niameyensis TaxID=1522308 RepID=UPI0007853931|nr:bifunctional metallophosphatase/5'-nucleotidase [Bacillus niameyensis]